MKNALLAALSMAALGAFVSATPASAQETVTGAPAGTAPVTVEGYGPSAMIVCNEFGDCWHVQQQYDYPPDVHVEVHPHDWRWNEGQHYVWREHPGRGYWQGREWVPF